MGAMHESRTNIVIDDKLMREAMKLTGCKTKRATVEEALRMVVRLKKQNEILDLVGKVEWVGNLNDMRTSKYAPPKRRRKAA
jgi:Arc/MetJ family transcription regulator